MAQGDSPVGIANLALIALGEAPITALSESNKRAVLCNNQYDVQRRFTLRTHPWGCARKQAQLAADATAPLFGWTSRYPVPADFIRFYSQSQDQGEFDVWEIMDGFIYTKSTGALDCTYIYDLQDCAKMDAALTHVIAYNLCSTIGLPLTQNPSRVEMALKQLEGKYSIARFISAQERAPREWNVDVLLWSRN